MYHRGIQHFRNEVVVVIVIIISSSIIISIIIINDSLHSNIYAVVSGNFRDIPQGDLSLIQRLTDICSELQCLLTSNLLITWLTRISSSLQPDAAY